MLARSARWRDRRGAERRPPVARDHAREPEDHRRQRHGQEEGQVDFVAAKDGQALQQGDTIKTDAAGRAEIDYTDGSLTRLGELDRVHDHQAHRTSRAVARPRARSRWARPGTAAAKVSETGSFEVKAGGTTAAVEGTAFVVVCVDDAGKLTCTVHRRRRQREGHHRRRLRGPAAARPRASWSRRATSAPVNNLTYDDLANNIFIAGNLALDQQAGNGKGLRDLPPPRRPPPRPAPARRRHRGRGARSPAATRNAQITVTADPTVLAEQYPPAPAASWSTTRTSDAGGEVTFRGAGCAPNEVLQVLFDGKPIGTITADARARSPGSITIPKGTAPGAHLLTVRGSVCVLNATITVLGGRLGVHRLVQPHEHLRARRASPRSSCGSSWSSGPGVGVGACAAVAVVAAALGGVSFGADLDERIRCSAGIWLFSTCTDDELGRIAALAHPQEAAVGDELTRQGDEGLEFFVIVDGDASRSGRRRRGRHHRARRLLRRDGADRRRRARRHRHRDHDRCSCSCSTATTSTRCSSWRCRRSRRSSSRSSAPACAPSTSTTASTPRSVSSAPRVHPRPRGCAA